MNLAEQREQVPCLSDDPITFTKEEACGLWHPHNNAIVANLRIVGRKFDRILINNGNSSDILFKSTLNKMDLVGESMKPTKSVLFGFTGKSVEAEGIFSLPVKLCTYPSQHIQTVCFVVIDCPSVYNVIIRCLTLIAIRAIISTYHLFYQVPYRWRYRYPKRATRGVT